MTRLHQCGLLFFLIALPLYLQAAKRVTFNEQPTVAIRQTNRVLARGELISVDPETVVIRVGSGFTAKEVEIDVTSITTLRSLDGDIQFKATDGIGQFIDSLTSRSDVEVTAVNLANAGNEPATDQPAPVNGGFGAATSSSGTSKPADSPAMNPVLNGGFGSADNNSSTNTNASNSETKIIVVCDNCKKEVSVNAEYGQECPHCGILWDIDAPSGNHQHFNSTTPGNQGTTPSAGGAPSDGGGGAQPVANQRVQAPDGMAPPSIQNAPAPVSMENLPLWMKASIFFGCIAVMYYFFFYRA